MTRAEIIERAINSMVAYAEDDQTTWENLVSLWQLTMFVIAVRFGLQKHIDYNTATGRGMPTMIRHALGQITTNANGLATLGYRFIALTKQNHHEP